MCRRVQKGPCSTVDKARDHRAWARVVNKEDHLEPGSSRTFRILQTHWLSCWPCDRVTRCWWTQVPLPLLPGFTAVWKCAVLAPNLSRSKRTLDKLVPSPLERGGVARGRKLSRNCSRLIAMLVKLVSDYFTCTWKSEEKTNISVVCFILFDLLQPLSALSALSLRKVSIF